LLCWPVRPAGSAAREYARDRVRVNAIARAAVFLASDDARSITGQVIAVNGGLFE
jgi:NAD(P)-dependent dehydrogenase (short-subunit alcohol dehydrogenase family)